MPVLEICGPLFLVAIFMGFQYSKRVIEKHANEGEK
jgi:hypothetical protein